MSMAIFNSFVKLPEGKWICPLVDMIPSTHKHIYNIYTYIYNYTYIYIYVCMIAVGDSCMFASVNRVDWAFTPSFFNITGGWTTTD